uniref:sigma-70 family RNA polymerase sigma factor n=1 Tax=Anaerobutyricum hallii TaxID=39488 RepID=UPI003FEF7577
METNEELVYKVQKAKAIGDSDKIKELCDILYKKNKGLIFETALSYKKIYAKNNEDGEDFDSIAKQAFIKAIFSYDPTRVASFATWAKYNEIHFALSDYIRKDKLIQIPCKLQALIKLYNQIVETYKEMNHGLFPSDKFIFLEMNKKVKVTPKRMEDIRAGKAALKLVSLDTPIDENGTTGQDIIDRREFDMEEKSSEEIVIEKEESRKIAEEYNVVRNMIQALSPVEQDILNMVYFEGMKQTEVAKVLGRDKQYVNKKLQQSYKHLLKMKEIQNIGKNRGWLSNR